jgi:DNA polymerase IV
MIKADVHVVDQRYVSDCLVHKCILPAENRLFRLRLAPEDEESQVPAKRQASPVQAITPALEIKQKKRKLEMTPSPEARRTIEASMQDDDKDFATAVDEAKNSTHLPLDDSDDEPDLTGDIDKDWNTSKYLRSQKTFQCMHRNGGSVDDKGPNALTIQILGEMSQYYDKIQDQWRTLGYRKAVTTLRKQTKRIATKEEAIKLPGIGARLAEKIEEIALTNRLRRLENAKDDSTDKVLSLFLGVYGVGPKLANKWIQNGHQTLDDVVQKEKLSENQRIGVEHYEDFQSRIPREEVTKHGELVRVELKKLDPKVQVTVGGSYRRGAEDSGDIDLIITKEGASNHEMAGIVFNQLIPKLERMGFITAKLATGSYGGDKSSKMHGCSVLPGSTVWRRIDFLLVPWNEVGAALIYFTGNDIFNRSLRLLARKKGMRLNQCGLFRNVHRDKAMKKMNEGEMLESHSEKRIFAILGVPWRPPQDRNC